MPSPESQKVHTQEVAGVFAEIKVTDVILNIDALSLSLSLCMRKFSLHSANIDINAQLLLEFPLRPFQAVKEKGNSSCPTFCPMCDSAICVGGKVSVKMSSPTA